MSHDYLKHGDAIDYTNGGTALAAGEVVVANSKPLGITHRPIAANETIPSTKTTVTSALKIFENDEKYILEKIRELYLKEITTGESINPVLHAIHEKWHEFSKDFHIKFG